MRTTSRATATLHHGPRCPLRSPRLRRRATPLPAAFRPGHRRTRRRNPTARGAMPSSRRLRRLRLCRGRADTDRLSRRSSSVPPARARATSIDLTCVRPEPDRVTTRRDEPRAHGPQSKALGDPHTRPDSVVSLDMISTLLVHPLLYVARICERYCSIKHLRTPFLQPHGQRSAQGQGSQYGRKINQPTPPTYLPTTLTCLPPQEKSIHSPQHGSIQTNPLSSRGI